MKPVFLAVAAAVLIVALIFINIATGGAVAKKIAWVFGPHGPVGAGQPFPKLTFQTLDGSTEILTPAPGRVTFVNVFATWCPPCKAETPDLAAFAKAESGRGVDVVGIDQEETPDAVDAFRQAFGTTYPMVIDTGRITKDLLGARIIPRTLVVDGHGIVRAEVSGPMTRAQMDQLAAAAAS